MIIEKRQKTYIVREHKDYWSVNAELGGLSVEIKVDKTICETEQVLREYIEKNDEIF